MLERLDRGVEAVGHVAVGGVQPVGVGTGTHTAGGGLVVGEGFPVARVDAANREVGHGAVAGCRDDVGDRPGKGTENHVDDALRGFDVAAGDRGGRQGVDQRAFGRDHLEGP